jgi:hypothetical protein
LRLHSCARYGKPKTPFQRHFRGKLILARKRAQGLLCEEEPKEDDDAEKKPN